MMRTAYESALASYQASDLRTALAGFYEVIADDSRHTGAHYHLGLVLHALGRTAEGIAHYESLLQRYPDYLDAWINLGDLQGKAGCADAAIAAWERALALDPDSLLVLNNLAVTSQHQGHTEKAIAYARRAVALDPALHALWNLLGNKLLGQGRHPDAERAWRQSLRIDDRQAQVWNNLAVTLGHLNREDEAITAYRRALGIDPDLADGLNNLALALHGRDQSDEALTLLRRCTAQHPAYALGWANLGMVLQGMGELEEAIAAIDQALALTPDHPGWLWNQSLAYLTLGNFSAGWARFETRYHPARGDSNFPDPGVSSPMWQGEPLAGKSLLLVKEQGFGDQIQCLRFARDLAAQGAIIDVWVHPALAALFATAPGIRRVFTEKPADPYDYWAYLMSLPARLRVSEDSLTTGFTPYLLAEPEKLARATAQIDTFAQGRLRVGINWAGNPTHPNDRHRSLPVQLLASLLKISEIAWISLQKERVGAAQEQVNAGQLLPLGDAIADFGDTAALLAGLDLLITVDSAVAHLAGAMGVRTWLWLPAKPDYRWMRERTDTPWYPTVQLWRQPQLGDWRPVIDAMGQSLADHLGSLWEPSSFNHGASEGRVETQALVLAGPQRLIPGRHGWFVYNRQDQYVGQALENYGEYAEYEVQWFSRLLARRPGEDVVEVGANIGSQAVPLAKLARNYFGFEPQPSVFHVLCANLAVNHLNNARAFPFGVGDHEGLMHLPTVDYAVEGNFGGITLLSEGAGMPVDVVELDAFLPKVAPGLKLGLLKVDVEGMEHAVLSGAETLIRRDQPFLYVENNRIEQSPALIRLLWSFGYQLFWHCPLLFNPDNHFANPHDKYPGIAACNLLGVPAGVEIDTAGMSKVVDADVHILRLPA